MLNRRNPLCPTEAWVVDPGPLRGIDGTVLARTGAPTSSRGFSGRGATYPVNGTDGHIVTIGSAHRLCLQPPMSFMWVGVHNTAPASNAHLFGAVYDNAGGSPYLSWSISDGQSFASNSSGTFDAISAGANAAIGKRLVMIAVRRIGAMELWTNGALVASGTPASDTIAYSATSSVSFDQQATTGRESNSTHLLGAVWKRGLTPSEIQRLTQDPWRFFR